MVSLSKKIAWFLVPPLETSICIHHETSKNGRRGDDRHWLDMAPIRSSQLHPNGSSSTGSSETSKRVCCLLADVAELRRLIAGSKHVPCWASAWNVGGETRDVAAMECHGMQWTCWCEVGAGLTGLRYGGAPIETRSGWSLSACTPKRLGSNFWILYSGFLPEVGSGCKGACERWKQMGDLNSPERLKAWLTVVWDGLAVGVLRIASLSVESWYLHANNILM